MRDPNSNIKLRYILPALIALTMVTYGLFISAVNTRSNLEDSRRVAHSRKVIIALQDTLRFMLELKIRQRDFILSGDNSHLTEYERTLEDGVYHLQLLAELTRENPIQEAQVKVISEVITERMDEIRRTIALTQQDPRAGLREIQTDTGTFSDDELRSLIDPMREEQLSHLEKSQKQLEESLRKTNLTLFISDGVAIAAGVLGAASLVLFLSIRDREENLRIQKEKAEDADRAKSEFMAMMSHEIRTPMNAILGFGELLNESVKTPREKHFTGAILSSGNALLSLINDILDLSKVEAGKLEIQPESVEIAKFAENLETLFSFQALEKNLKLRVLIEPETPPFLLFDSLRLRQVIINLVGNAIKFTREGTVSLSIGSIRKDDGEVDKLRIRVSDTGIGISESHLSEIFRPFYQIDSIQGRRFQGTGLGLSISVRLTEAMGGGISVESRINQGSQFSVVIPTWPSHEERARPLEETPDTKVHAPKEFGRTTTDIPALKTPSADLLQLCTSLNHIYQNVWPDLVRLVPAQGTIRFSDELTNLSKRYGNRDLANYAMELMDSAMIMDFAESERLLKQFPEIINNLRSTHG